MGLKIQNGRVIDATNKLNYIGDIYIQDGKITAFNDAPPNFNADEIIDVTGQIVCAGFVDLSVRLQNLIKETIEATSSGVT